MSFSGIAFILVIAAVFGTIARFMKQPILIGFLFAGLFLSYFGLITDHSLLDNLGKIGVALLLFLVGMEMNIGDISTIGKTALILGVSQVIATVCLGFLISLALGFGLITSVYIAIALTFSSTIIIVKLLSEKDDVNSLYGKISVGFLLVQDLIAFIILLFLAGIKGGNFGLVQALILASKAGIMFWLVWYLSKDILPKLFSKIVGNSQELLFTVSIAWALGVATLVGGPLGFSFEIGGFLAGLALSNLPEHLGVSSKTKSLRDFFLTIFFVTLGSQLFIGDILKILPLALMLSGFVLLIKPLIIIIIMGLLGHKSRTSFFVSTTVAQVSEFSFILMAMGKGLGHLTESNVALIVLVGAITMTASTYLMLGSEKIYFKIKNFLKAFEKKNTTESAYLTDFDYKDHVVMIGCDKIGTSLLPYFRKHNLPHIVVDFNPSVFKRLTSEKTNVLLGDIADTEIAELSKIKSAKIVICTVPNIVENLSIINTIKNLKNKPVFVGSANSRQDTIKLYEEGADYVLNPDIIAGEFLRHMFNSHGFSEVKISKMGKSHFNRMVYLKSFKNL